MLVLLAGSTAPAAASAGHPRFADDPGFPGDPGASGPGIPGVFIFFFIVVLAVGIGVTIWRVTTAQRLAKQSGLDPRLATKMTLLSDDGLDATYLAASLRKPPVTSDPPGAEPAPEAQEPAASAADRLTQLKSLLDQDLLTRAEYDERRKAIIDSV